MTDRLTITLAQINPVVGDIDGNIALIRRIRGQSKDADLVVFPELAVCGYPPEDLVLKPFFQEKVEHAVKALAGETADGGPAMLVPTPWRDDGKLYNAVLLLDQGEISAMRFKHDLPNYGVFDEKRIFASGPMPGPVNFRDVRLGVPICEDIWAGDVAECLAESGAEILLVPNGSPVRDRQTERSSNACGRADHGNRVAARLCQSSWGTGRTGVRRRVLRAQCGLQPGRPGAGLAGSVHDHRLDAQFGRRLAVRARRDRAAADGARRHVQCHGAGPARLCSQKRLSRRYPRPLGRDRFGAERRGGGRRVGRGKRPLRHDAVALYQPRKRRGCGRSGQADGNPLRRDRHRARDAGVRNHAQAGLRRPPAGHHGRKRPGAQPRSAADEHLQQIRRDAPDHRQQIGNGGRLRDAVWRHERWVFRAQGCLQDRCLPAVDLA